MLDNISHPHFYLVQLSLFSICIYSVLYNYKNGWMMISEFDFFYYSPFYKIAVFLLVFGSFIISFIEFKWWSSILYFIATFITQGLFANIFVNVIIPKRYFEPRFETSISNRFWSLIILLNFILLIVLLFCTFYVIFF